MLIPESTCGSDEAGLVCGYVFEPNEDALVASFTTVAGYIAFRRL